MPPSARALRARFGRVIQPWVYDRHKYSYAFEIKSENQRNAWQKDAKADRSET
jgi:hypothetical protein